MNTKLGIADFTYFMSKKSGLVDDLMLIEKASQMKLDTVQVDLGIQHADSGKSWRKSLRKKAESLGIELIGAAYGGNGEADFFDQILEASQELGVKFIRQAFGPFLLLKEPMPEDELVKKLQIAADKAQRARIPIAVENHQDYPSENLAQMIEKVDSPYIGVMLDTGNSIALLEDPLATAQILAPYTMGVHLKEYVAFPAAGGFDLVGVALGEGVIDNVSILQIVQEKSKRDVMYVTVENPLERCNVNLLSLKYVNLFKDKPLDALRHVAGFIEESISKYPDGIVLPDEAGYEAEKIAFIEDEHNRKAVAYAKSIFELSSVSV